MSTSGRTPSGWKAPCGMSRGGHWLFLFPPHCLQSIVWQRLKFPVASILFLFWLSLQHLSFAYFVTFLMKKFFCVSSNAMLSWLVLVNKNENRTPPSRVQQLAYWFGFHAVWRSPIDVFRVSAPVSCQLSLTPAWKIMLTCTFVSCIASLLRLVFPFVLLFLRRLLRTWSDRWTEGSYQAETKNMYCYH